MVHEELKSIDFYDFFITYKKLESQIVWHEDLNKGKQTSVQYMEGEDPFLSSIGKLKKNCHENYYNKLNPLFKNTVFENIINDYKLVRSRLMWVYGKTCYSIHKDPSKRIHIPIVTNKNCLFIFPEIPKLIHLPIGKAYSVDTTKQHSFCNFSEEPRLHFLGCIY